MEDAGVWIATLNDESQSSKAKLAALAALAQRALASPDEVLSLFDGVDVAFERLLIDKEVREGTREAVAGLACPGGSSRAASPPTHCRRPIANSAPRSAACTRRLFSSCCVRLDTL